MIKPLLIGSLVCATAATTRADDNAFFNGNELSVSPFGIYVDKTEGRWGGGLSLDYFFTSWLGVGALTHWENIEGSFIDNLAGEAIFRLPLGGMPVAPYGIGTIGYSWETEEWFEGLGAGAEFRFSSKVGLFGDIQWQFNNEHQDGVAVRAGLRFVF